MCSSSLKLEKGATCRRSNQTAQHWNFNAPAFQKLQIGSIKNILIRNRAVND